MLNMRSEEQKKSILFIFRPFYEYGYLEYVHVPYGYLEYVHVPV